MKFLKSGFVGFGLTGGVRFEQNNIYEAYILKTNKNHKEHFRVVGVLGYTVFCENCSGELELTLRARLGSLGSSCSPMKLAKFTRAYTCCE